MGICAHKQTYEEDPLPMHSQPQAKRHIFHKLLDLKNDKKTPVVSLANNPLYLHRQAARKTSSSDYADTRETKA